MSETKPVYYKGVHFAEPENSSMAEQYYSLSNRLSEYQKEKRIHKTILGTGLFSSLIMGIASIFIPLLAPVTLAYMYSIRDGLNESYNKILDTDKKVKEENQDKKLKDLKRERKQLEIKLDSAKSALEELLEKGKDVEPVVSN
ncbi:MAG: hypothetical protein PHI86_06155 [Candidatus Omnitrophica bacterium]|nr:hypothetical protein [Candidatus Omnitrophota bacterium]